MKANLIIATLIAFALNASAIPVQKPILEKGTYSLKGNIEGFSDGPIYLAYYSKTKQTGVTDTAMVKGGSFAFKGALLEPVIAFVRINRNKQTFIFIEPAEMQLKLKLDQFDQVELRGSKPQDLYVALEAKRDSIRSKYASQLASYKEETDPLKKDQLKAALNPYYLEMRQADLTFFDRNPNSVVTGFLLTNGYLSKLTPDQLQGYYQKIKDDQGIMTIYKQQLNDGIDRAKRNQLGKKTVAFKTIDANNDSLSIAQFSGKYVLLDFWATWCVPCRQKTPHMIELYDKYKASGFEVVGIADDDYRVSDWKKAIKDDRLPWRNILRGQDKTKTANGVKNPNDLSELFDVHVLPTLVLLDKEGRIIDRFIGNEKSENERLEKKLKTLFGQ